jgi:hypothetical protein
MHEIAPRKLRKGPIVLRCREISKMVSESMERPLPFRQRMQVWMHLAMCGLCNCFARQLRLLRRAAHEHPDRLDIDVDDPEARLSEEARERIRAALRRSDG